MTQERLFVRSLLPKAKCKRPVGRLRINSITRWIVYIENLGWNRLGLYLSELMEVVEDRKVWQVNLELVPPQSSLKSWQ